MTLSLPPSPCLGSHESGLLTISNLALEGSRLLEDSSRASRNVETDTSMRAPLPPLTAYEVSEATGFVPEADPVIRLSRFDPWEDLAPEISALIRTRRLRAALSRLPELDAAGLQTAGERERGLLLLTVFANGWVWGGVEPDLTIPQQIARPLCMLAEAMGRPPIVHYASMALNNWRRLDRSQPVSADNVRMQVQFLGGVDEDWFFVGSLGVELAGAPLVASAHAAVEASERHGDAELQAALTKVSADLDPVIAALARMYEWCDPHVFYHRVRPYLRGWPDPGVVYQGASETPQTFVGGSAGQSTLIQAVDAVLGVQHRPAATADYLKRLRTYMPSPHRRLVEDIEARTVVRRRVETGSAGLHAAYNEAIAQLDRFRRRHIELANRYIVKPSGGSTVEKGTGGTDLEVFLEAARGSTAEARL